MGGWGQVLIGFAATLGMIALSIVSMLLVGFVILWIVSYVPIVGRRGQRHPRTARESIIDRAVRDR